MIEKHSTGSRPSVEYYIRSFYREMLLHRAFINDTYKNRLFWLNQILAQRSFEVRVKLLVIIYGPLIRSSSMPRIGWWDLTHTFFVDSGLEDLGLVLFMIFSNRNNKEEVEGIENVLSESICVLVFGFDCRCVENDRYDDSTSEAMD